MQLQGLLTNVTYVGIIGLFVFVAWRALRRGARADIDASLFFGALAGISMLGLVFGPSRPDQAFAVLLARSVMALALTGPEDAVLILQAGADAYRSKPVDIAELRRLVASLLVDRR